MSAAIDFLKELADRLVNQDNHFTASPNYCIQERKIICGIKVRDTAYGNSQSTSVSIESINQAMKLLGLGDCEAAS